MSKEGWNPAYESSENRLHSSIMHPKGIKVTPIATTTSPPFMGEYSEPFDIYTEVDENDDDDTPKKPSTSGSSGLKLLSSSIGGGRVTLNTYNLRLKLQNIGMRMTKKISTLK